MSKAEEKSKQYRDFREQCGIKDPVMLDEIEEAYYEGYNKSEKDNELTWEDMREIDKLSGWLLTLKGNSDDKEFYQEVLKRFKERKEK